MARFRKAAALLACAVMASSVTSCADTTYSAKYGDETVKAGVYIAYLQNELNNQIYMFSYQGIESKDYFSQQVDGVDLADYVKNNAEKDVKEYIAIKKQFEAEGLTLSDDELKTLSGNVNTSWDNMGGLYEYNGVSKESLKELYRESLMRTKLFEKYYGVDGTEAPTAEEMQTYVNDNYIRYKMIAVYKSSNSDESAAAAENEENLKTRDEFYEKGKDLTFEEFDTLISEYRDYSSSAAEAASGSADESSETPDDTSIVDDTSSSSESTESVDSEASSEETSSESSSEAEAPSEPNASDEEAAAPTESESAADSSQETSSEDVSDASSEEAASGTDSSAAESEPDPYENEAVIDLAGYTDEDYESASGKLFKFVKEAEVGKVLTFENDNAYYIVIKGDIADRTDYVSENRDTIVQSMKNDEFQSKIDSWVTNANITLNDKALKRYTPQVIYDRMVEYSNKNSTT